MPLTTKEAKSEAAHHVLWMFFDFHLSGWGLSAYGREELGNEKVCNLGFQVLVVNRRSSFVLLLVDQALYAVQ